ncbi:LysR family transcriptional regulator [Eubacteriaceae bacterium ES2]|nr:LysR family transcriptional regulator [Eubacteriaceae bacterium ES2]
MELKNLNTFKTIVETGSFLRAAQKLNYSQSTITFQIQKLEQDLSVKLFEKIGRQMALTQTGKDLLPYVETILLNAKQLENYSKSSHNINGNLSISMAETLLTYRLQPVLKSFRQLAPDVKLSVQSLNCPVIREQILNGSTDIGIHYDIGGYASSAQIEKLADYSLILVGSSELEKKFCDFTSSGQRKDLCLITTDREKIFDSIFNDYLKRKDIILSGKMNLGSIEAIKKSTISNLGVAYLPRYTVEDELENKSLKELNTEISDQKISTICVHHKNKWLTPAMKLFIQLLKENL